MEREKFIKGLSEIETLDNEYIRDVVKQTIYKEKILQLGHNNLLIAVEECSELQKEVIKFIRGRGDKYNLVEEMADVMLGIYYIQEVLKVSDEELQKAISVKTKRLEGLIKK